MPPSGSRRSNSRRVAAERGGHRGETIAALLLRLKFYRILARRFRTPVGEIDLVAQRGSTIAFVEVKSRARGTSEEDTLDAVNTERIARAAEYWLMKHPAYGEHTLRFDLVLVSPGRWPSHRADAFRL